MRLGRFGGRGFPAYQQEMTLKDESLLGKLMFEVYWWMGLGLSATAIAALIMASSMQLMMNLMRVYWLLIIVEFILVIVISNSLKTLSVSTAKILFFIYSILNGVTLSVVFMVFTKSSIASTFFITAGMFILMAMYGYYTKKNLASWGNTIIMLLIGLILALIVNLFLGSPILNYWISLAAVILFSVLVIYDVNRIKMLLFQMNTANHNRTGEQLEADSPIVQKIAVIGALMLYLDFINLFIYLLQFFGDRRD